MEELEEGEQITKKKKNGDYNQQHEDNVREQDKLEKKCRESYRREV